MSTSFKSTSPTKEAKTLEIIRAGHPTLRERAKTVEDPTSPEIHEIVAKMRAKIDELGPEQVAGLAAPQVNISYRIFLFRKPDQEKLRAGTDETAEELEFHVAINPEISPAHNTRDEMWEGCYSMPGIVFKLPRYTHIKYRYQDLHGNWHEGEAKGYTARIMQHENDHLLGHLEIDRLEDSRNFGFLEEIRQHQIPQDPDSTVRPRWAHGKDDPKASNTNE